MRPHIGDNVVVVETGKAGVILGVMTAETAGRTWVITHTDEMRASYGNGWKDEWWKITVRFQDGRTATYEPRDVPAKIKITPFYKNHTSAT